MKGRHELKRQAILLLIVGTLCMSFTLLTKHFFETPLDLEDFLKGLGVTFVIYSYRRNWKEKHNYKDVNKELLVLNLSTSVMENEVLKKYFNLDVFNENGFLHNPERGFH